MRHAIRPDKILVRLTEHVAPYVKHGRLRKSRRLSDALIVIKQWGRGKSLIDERERLERLAGGENEQP